MRFTLAALLTLALGPAINAQPKKGQKATWYTDYPKAKAEAVKKNKLLFVVFRCQP